MTLQPISMRPLDGSARLNAANASGMHSFVSSASLLHLSHSFMRRHQPSVVSVRKTSANVPMLFLRIGTTMNRMEILISLDQLDPPQGRLRRGSRRDVSEASEDQAIPFGGWLGLMRALSELVESRD
jgi:hypothetical protein